LRIKEIVIERIELNEKEEVIIKVRSTKEGTKCRKCGREIREEYGEDEAIRLRHLSILDNNTYIEIKPKRYRCGYCQDKPTTTQELEWYNARSGQTKAYEKYILRQLINNTIEDVSIKERVGYKAIEGIINRNISNEINWDEIVEIYILGLDEISLKKGHRDFVTVVSSKSRDGEVKVIAILEGRKKETVENFLKSIPERLKGTIDSVCTDIYDGFINAVKEQLPNAKIVIDRFHVAKAYRNCSDNLRKEEMNRLKKLLPKEEQEEIKHTMWMFRKNKQDLDKEEKQKLKKLFQYSPKLEQAYNLREQLTAIFDQDLTKVKATQKINRWKNRVIKSGLTCFDPFLTTIDNWIYEITNYFVDRNSSGFVEGFNNKIKVLKRRCYGIFNLTHLFQRIVIDTQGYDLFAI
jgi:transposase